MSKKKFCKNRENKNVQNIIYGFLKLFFFGFLRRRRKCFNFALKNFCHVLLPDRSDVSYPPMIETINLLEPSADFLAPGDRVHQVDGVSTVGLTNDQVMNLLLCNRDENAVIEIEYSLPDYRKSLSVIDEMSDHKNPFLISFTEQLVRHNKIGTGCS